MSSIGSKGSLFAIVALLTVLFQLSPLSTALDNRLLDSAFSLLRSIEPTPLEDDVVLVGIEENTGKGFDEPFSLWHPHIGRFIKAVSESQARLLALDIVLPDRSYDSLLPGYDRQLLAGLLAARDRLPLVLAQTVDGSGDIRPIFPPIISLAGQDALGLVLVYPDPDGVVRRYTPELVTDRGSYPSLVHRMAEQLNAPREPGLIDYTLGQPISYIPMQQVLDWHAQGDQGSLARFRDKVVLLGSVLPFADRHRLPVPLAAWEPGNRRAPGVLVHVQALRTLMHEGIVKTTHPLTTLALALVAILLLSRVSHPLVTALLALSALVILGLVTIGLLGTGIHLQATTIAIGILLTAVARFAFTGMHAFLERRRLTQSFGRYVSPNVLEGILDGQIDPAGEGRQLPLCVLFSDIRSFTRRSESLPPEEVVALLNRYFDQMVAAVHDKGGTVDKFIGDGLMAFFGAPNPQDNPAQAAFAAARDMMQRLETLNKELEQSGTSPIRIGIGLHLGDAVVGHVGASSRLEYTAIGDTVNLASRLEGLSKTLGYTVIMSGEFADALPGDCDLVELGEQHIKGHTPVQIYGWGNA
ncbi:MAG: adenylate/guanylate cyclase domain-containing protein [Sedimenticola sp.]